MDSLINKWKATVDNHNKKLKNLREESLTRSLSRERTAAITASSLLLQSKAAQSTGVASAAGGNEMTFSLQNQKARRRRPRIDASSSSSNSDNNTDKRQHTTVSAQQAQNFDSEQEALSSQQSTPAVLLSQTQVTQIASQKDLNHHIHEDQQLKSSSERLSTNFAQSEAAERSQEHLFAAGVDNDPSLMESMLNATSLIECEDQETMNLVKSILDLFPAKRHLGQPLADLLVHFNGRQISERVNLETQLQQTKLNQEQFSAQNDIQVQRKAELDRQIENASVQVRQLQEHISEQENLDQLQMKKYGQIKSQQNVLNLLSESQSSLQKANASLQNIVNKNEERFAEQEHIWEQELSNMKDLLQHSNHRSKA